MQHEYTSVHDLWHASDLGSCRVYEVYLRCSKSQSCIGVHCTNTQQGVRECTLCSGSELLIAEQIQKTSVLPASPAGYPELENEPWWCCLDMRLVQKRRAELSSASLVYSPGCGAVNVSKLPGLLVTRAYWEPSQVLLCREKMSFHTRWCTSPVSEQPQVTQNSWAS